LVRKSCSRALCSYASLPDLLLYSGRPPRLADLDDDVKSIRDDSFRPDKRITDLIRRAKTYRVDPGVACPDNCPDFTALQVQVRAALTAKPSKKPELARGQRLAPDARRLQPTTTPALIPIREGCSTPMTTIQCLLDLAATPPTHHDEALLLLGEANELYQQDLMELAPVSGWAP